MKHCEAIDRVQKISESHRLGAQRALKPLLLHKIFPAALAASAVLISSQAYGSAESSTITAWVDNFDTSQQTDKWTKNVANVVSVSFPARSEEGQMEYIPLPDATDSPYFLPHSREDEETQESSVYQSLTPHLTNVLESYQTQRWNLASTTGYNLNNWKLTLPFSNTLLGGPVEITQPNLATYQNLKYFYFNTAIRGLVFRAPCGGVATEGSSYPRSELREMFNFGKTPASWSTTSGIHTMEITEAITSLPAVKPQLVAGQIHSATSDVIVVRLEGQKLFFDENGIPGPVMTNQYRLGDVFTVKIQARNGKVYCYYNGLHIGTLTTSATGCYFKAGCYLQSNLKKGDAPTAFGEVIIYRLSVSHVLAPIAPSISGG